MPTSPPPEPLEARIPKASVLAALEQLRQFPIADAVLLMAPQHADNVPVALQLIDQIIEHLREPGDLCITATKAAGARARFTLTE